MYRRFSLESVWFSAFSSPYALFILFTLYYCYYYSLTTREEWTRPLRETLNLLREELGDPKRHRGISRTVAQGKTSI